MANPSQPSEKRPAASPALVRLCGQRSHDITNVVQSAMSRVELLLRHTSFDENVLTGLADVAECLDKIKALLSDCKADAAVPFVPVHAVDVAAVFRQAIRTAWWRASTNIALVITHPEKPITITVSEIDLFLALLNLITNAIQAIGPADGTITVTCGVVNAHDEIPELTRRVYRMTDQPHLLLRVSDTGCGMSEEQILLSYQMSHTTKEDGSGRGLLIVRGFVESQGGGLHIKSAVGVGTTFSIYLPMETNTPSSRTSASGIRMIAQDPENG